MSSPRVVLGAPVFNHERECREAIESILAQTFRDFGLIIVDDCSTDGTAEVLRQYAEVDPRVVYVRNDQRLGMIDNWKRAFELGLERWPGAEYFAWASDHDLWHPRWLSRLVQALDEAPEAVLAYPWNARAGADGALTTKRPWKFDTNGVKHRGQRFRMALRSMSAGNMIYGLARARDVKACGVFRHVLVPDRLLIMELALRGEFRQVHEVLWFRRWYGNIFSLGRQRRAFFPNGRPLYALVPWWISHAAVLGWLYGVRGEFQPAITRVQGIGLSVMYFFLAGLLHLRQQLKQVRVDLLERATYLRPYYNLLKRVGRRISKDFGIGDAVRTTQKNIGDSSRRQRIRAKAVKRLRNVAYGAATSASNVAAKGIRSVPGVGPRLLPWLLREQLQMSIGATELLQVQKLVGTLRRDTRPIVVGPFLGDADFELLYWIPFLRWLFEAGQVESSRVTVVSRGGVGSWYGGLCERYLDALDVKRLGDLNARGQVRWHVDALDRVLTPTVLDTSLVDAAVKQHGLGDPIRLHPSVMQQLFRHAWKGSGPHDLIGRHARHGRLVPPADPDDLRLPERYVAMHVTFGPAFPDTITNQRIARQLIEALAGHQPVVLLNTGFNLDRLEEFDPGPVPNVRRLDVALTPANSLAVQSAVLGRAERFVGALGGFSVLAAMYGVPGLSVYSTLPGATAALVHDLRVAAGEMESAAAVLHAREVQAFMQTVLQREPEPSLHA